MKIDAKRAVKGPLGIVFGSIPLDLNLAEDANELAQSIRQVNDRCVGPA